MTVSRFLMHSLKPSAVIVLVCATFAHCAMPNFDEFSGETSQQPPGQKVESPEEIPFDEEELSLTWDPPASDVVEYRVLYRIHGTADWLERETIPAGPSPEYTFYHADLGNGAYDFAVVAVDDEDNESAVHSSLDSTATPSSGWYIVWDR